MADPITVRSAREEDQEAWTALWKAYCGFYGVELEAHITPTLWSRIMDPNFPIWCLIGENPAQPGRPAGFANYVLHPYTWGTQQICYLEDLFVSEEVRGKGLGAALIAELKRLAQINGWPRLYWHTHESNATARALYDRFVSVDPFVRYVIKLP